jgi:uncharacterized protein (TIGR02757 family)
MERYLKVSAAPQKRLRLMNKKELEQYKKLSAFFNEKVTLYNHINFIESDPISIPHLFTKKQDIEIAALFAAVFAWGNRTTIINKTKELLIMMDMAPHEFILGLKENSIEHFTGFKHRTFKDDDLFFFLDFLHEHYSKNESLETAFSQWLLPTDTSTENVLIGFKKYFFANEHLRRTEKHISSPLQKSTCKRLNMFLRWMVRKDNTGVDFGLWQNIKPSQLIMPIDVHVARVAKHYGILQREQIDWQTAIELTDYLKQLDANDPVKYDFALFGLGVNETNDYK